MHHSFLPMLAALGALAYLAYRSGLLASRWAKLALAGLGLAVAVAASVEGGMDLPELGRLKLLIALATVLLVLARGSSLAILHSRGRYIAALGVLTSVSWLVYFNFFSFHGARTYLHIHDVAHYYLGSKYFAELGYGRMYTAMLRAEAEVYDDHFRSLEARDLETGGLYDIRALLIRSGPVKARFSEARWKDFCADVAYFREAMGVQYGEILRDHGFNPTPVWALIGGTLADLVPAGNRNGILALSLIDPVLEALLFVIVAMAFGLEASLFAQLYFTLLFGASFGWTGGAFMRHLWLFSLVTGVCCLRWRRPVVAGSLFALATALRVFPIVFVAVLFIRATVIGVKERRIPSSPTRMMAGFVLSGLILFGATVLFLPRGADHWSEFRVNMERHLQNTAYNTNGLERVLTWRGAAQPTDEASYDAVVKRQESTHRVLLFTAVPLVFLFIVFRARREDEVGAAGMGALLLYSGLDLAAYYYTFMLLPLLSRHRKLPRLAVLFGAQAVIYATALFEDREAVLYWYNNVLMGLVLIDLFVFPDRENMGTAWARFRGGSAQGLPQ